MFVIGFGLRSGKVIVHEKGVYTNIKTLHKLLL